MIWEITNPEPYKMLVYVVSKAARKEGKRGQLSGAQVLRVPTEAEICSHADNLNSFWK